MKKFSEAYEKIIGELESFISPEVRKRMKDDLDAFLDKHAEDLDEDEKKVVRRMFKAVEEITDPEELVDALIDASQYFTTSSYATEMSRILSMIINQDLPKDTGEEYSTSLATASEI